MRSLIFALAAASLAATSARAAELVLHGSTVGQSVMNRPATSGSINYPDSASYGADSAPFAVDPFFTDTSGHFHVASYASGFVGTQGIWNNFFGLYAGSFDPSEPLDNLVFFNDDIYVNGARAAGNPSTFEAQANVQYFAVTTGVNNASGIYTLLLASTGRIYGGLIGSAVPEVSTWAMTLIGFGAGGIAVRQRRARMRATSS